MSWLAPNRSGDPPLGCLVDARIGGRTGVGEVASQSRNTGSAAPPRSAACAPAESGGVRRSVLRRQILVVGDQRTWVAVLRMADSGAPGGYARPARHRRRRVHRPTVVSGGPLAVGGPLRTSRESDRPAAVTTSLAASRFSLVVGSRGTSPTAAWRAPAHQLIAARSVRAGSRL